MTDLLAGTRPDYFPQPDEPADPARRAQDLRVILAEPRQTRSPAPRRRLLTLAAATAVLAAAVVVATTVPNDQPADTPTSARQVFLAAAHAVETVDAPAAGRFWHVESRESLVYTHPDRTTSSASSAEEWFASTGEQSTRIDYPRDPKDHPEVTMLSGEPVFYVENLKLTMSEVLALPTTPESFQAWLLDLNRKNPPAPDAPPHNDDTMSLALETVNLLANVPATPQTRSAAYQFLAGLPGYRVLDAAELPDTSLVGVARKVRMDMGEATVTDGVVEHQVIIDPDTGMLVTSQYVLVEPGTEARPLRVGTVIQSRTVASAGWVDTEPVLPPDAVTRHSSFGE